jgi:hypothetical protein
MPELTRYIVGAYKIEPAQRNLAHAVITDEDPRGYTDVLDSDDDPLVPFGAPVAYAVDLTEDEAERFRGASNLRYLEEDGVNRPAVIDVEPVAGRAATGDQGIPPDSTMRYMGVGATTEGTWHGRDVNIAILDGGTTPAVRDRFAFQEIAHRDFTGSGAGWDTITVDHGCMVTPLAVPPAGKLIQAIVFDAEGYGYNSWIAAAVKWAVDSGASVVNFSGGGGGPSSAISDAFAYAATRGAVVVCSAGNSGQPFLEYPSRYSETMPTVVSSIAFNESTDRRADFSNYAATGSGAAPGQSVLTTGETGSLVRASGTSFSAPHMARLIAMGCTGAQHAPARVAQALTATARDTAEPDAEEGAGAWHLEQALTSLTAPGPAPTPPPANPLTGFPFKELDTWSSRVATWWPDYQENAARAYRKWRDQHPG